MTGSATTASDLLAQSRSPLDVGLPSSSQLFGKSTSQNSLEIPAFTSQSSSATDIDALSPAQFSAFSSGYFTVGNTGQVGIDYLFDGGSYEGELGIFSLSGLEQFDSGSDAFIQEVVRRILSDSTQGHLVINDHTDAARFTDGTGFDGNFNAGDYLGVKTVAMNPGDTFGVALLPHGSFQQILGNTNLWGNQRPLFSLVAANPNQGFQFGQIADVTGNGSTFALEDLRLDEYSDRDYNDVIFQVRGAIGVAASLDSMIAKDWRGSDFGQALLSYISPYDAPTTTQPIDYHFPQSNQPLIGIIDTGFAANNPDIDYSRITLGRDYVDGDINPLLNASEGNEHGTHILGIIGATQNNDIGIDGINDQAPLWLGRAIGSGKWAESLVEFVNQALESNQPNAVVNLSLDLTQRNPDGSVTTRYEFTPAERAALEYARQSGVLIVAAAGNDGGVMSVLGQASQEFDNIITVGAADGFNRADYSSYGYGLDILAPGNNVLSTVGNDVGTMTGTSVATAEVTGAVSQVWAANSSLNYRQVIEILKATATDLNTPGWDSETGVGTLNTKRAVIQAKMTQAKNHEALPIETLDTGFNQELIAPAERAADPLSTVSGTSSSTQTITSISWRSYQVAAGETLWGIAQRVLGDGNRWREIAKDSAGQQFFAEAEAVWLQVNQMVYLPIYRQVGIGYPVVISPNNTPTRSSQGAVGITSISGTPINDLLGVTPMPVIISARPITPDKDFNGDGKSDILWRNDDGTVHIWTMNGSQIAEGKNIDRPTNEWKIQGTGDFNGDGKDDVLWRNDDGTVHIWTMNGSQIAEGRNIDRPTNEWKIQGLDSTSKPSSVIPTGGSSTLSVPVNWNSRAFRESNVFWPQFAPPSAGGNLDAPGNCTWYVNGRLQQLGYNASILNKMSGNARDWDNQAPAGVNFLDSPKVGSIAQWESNHSRFADF